jgi:putative membrane protein
MGGADIIPGVSGGTVALILGIYQRLVTAISRFDLTFVAHLRSYRLRAAAAHVDLRFLAFLGLGIATGVVGLASTMHWLLEHHLERTFAAFFGMILASAFLVGRMVERWNVVSVATLGIATVFAYWLVGLPFLENPPDSVLYLFLCGAIAICAMILPGISGAFILLILGKYYFVTGVLRSFASLDFSWEGLTTVVVFGAGATVGLLSFSRVLRFLLTSFHATTMAALAGFMLGSLRKIWPFKTDLTPDIADFKLKQFENHLPEFDSGDPWVSLVIMVLAALFVLALERTSTRRSQTAES